MRYGLPKSVEICGAEFEIRYDFRVILDIFEALNDPELDDQDRALAVLQMFYLDFDSLPDYEEALKQCFWFINGGHSEKTEKKKPRLVDWEQDYPILWPPSTGYSAARYGIPSMTQTRIRVELHWWTFLGAYMEIGDCLFAQVVGIRSKKAQGKKLDKSEQEFYRKNRDLIDIKTHYTEAENDLLKAWIGG